jgi:hypothetical protein
MHVRRLGYLEVFLKLSIRATKLELSWNLFTALVNRRSPIDLTHAIELQILAKLWGWLTLISELLSP